MSSDEAKFDPRQVVELYLATFAARTDAYVDWDDSDPDPEKHHWKSIRAELTPDRLLEAFRSSGKPVSTYMETAAGATHVGAIDFDRDDGWAMGQAVAGKIAAAGGFPMLERSRRGCHLWVVLTEVVASEQVRLGLRQWVGEASKYAVRDPKVEIRPARLEQRGPETLGHPLRMPMMRHPTTGIRYPLCDATGNPLGERISAVVLAVQETPAVALLEAAARAPIPASEVHVPDWARRPPQVGGDVVVLLTAAGVQRAAPGRTVRCPAHDDKRGSLVISRDGERVWCKSPECLIFNNGRGLGADQLANVLGVNG